MKNKVEKSNSYEMVKSLIDVCPHLKPYFNEEDDVILISVEEYKANAKKLQVELESLLLQPTVYLNNEREGYRWYLEMERNYDLNKHMIIVRLLKTLR